MEGLHVDKDKIKKLSTFMEKLNTTSDKKALVNQYRDLLDAVKPIDLFYVDTYKHDTQYSIDDIKAQANKFVNVFYKGLKEHELTKHHHPFMQGLLKENQAIIDHLKSIKPLIQENDLTKNRNSLKNGFEKCLEFEKKFIKKENIIFPKLEALLPSTKPLETMWSLHDDARAQIKHILAYLNEDVIQDKALKELIGTYYYLIYGIIQKEKIILYPVAAKVLNDKTLDAMYEESKEYGYTFTEAPPLNTSQSDNSESLDGIFKVKTGELNLKQLKLMLNHLPVDITFVDKDDKVRYFNQTTHRHFPRNPSIIGRRVEHCHPPKSVDTVKRIVQAFKNKEKDFAEFYITFKNRFLYITYYAVYDEDNQYEGVLEVSQDASHIRELKGEQRLLSWDE
jgi:DUF438 domain-containing protein